MTDWLKLTLQYLYRVRGSIFLHLASCFSIALIASLYHIPIQAIGYMILFISSMALLFLGIGCHQFRRRMQYLRVVWNGADVQLGTLPPAHGHGAALPGYSPADGRTQHPGRNRIGICPAPL